MAKPENKDNNKDGGVLGVNTDKAMVAVEVGRAATHFLPGGLFIKSAADASLAGVNGGLEQRQDRERLAAAGIDADDRRANYNPALKTRKARFADRWKGRMGEAVAAGAAGAGGAWGGAAAGAALGGAAGTAVLPVIGTTVGGALGFIGGGVGGLAAGYVGRKVYRSVVPFDEKDGVDLALTIVDAQKAGHHVPAEVIFAQWAASNKGTTSKELTEDLKAYTGLSNFNDAVEQGRFAELRALMSKTEYESAMRYDMGTLPDTDNPGRHVADQVAEWVNSRHFEAKNLVLGREYMPVASLADAQREGHFGNPVVMPSVPLARAARVGPSGSVAPVR
jgi:hypothetical protein